jgi:hypothetical protein
MTLKEKIQDVEIGKGLSDKIEQIADDYAIEFAEWLLNSNHFIKLLDTKQLLETFKKEKGL